jgi:pimeloyl-ACP methyl ester carboxylesterase
MPRRHKVHVDKQQAIENFYLVPRQATRNRYIIEHLADEAVGQPPEGVGWALRFDPNLRAKTEFGDLANLIGDAKCSLAFVRGSDSLVVDDETWADHRVQAPPMTPFIEIPEAGHHVMVDQPLALVATLRALLANMHLDQTIKQLR